MIVSKRSLLQLQSPYAIRTVNLAGVDHVMMSTEGYGPVFLASPPSWRPVRIANGPGGVMAFSRPVGRDASIFAIMGCFPGFQFHGAGIYRFRPVKGLAEMWEQVRVLGLPFAHRLEVVHQKERQILVAATLAQTKDSPEDWSRAGTVYSCTLARDGSSQEWALRPVFADLHKNHGFLVLEGATDDVLVSGTEGVFRLRVSPENTSRWSADKWLDRKVSELALVDLDSDGKEEMITIEGFHGDALCIYRRHGTAGKK